MSQNDIDETIQDIAESHPDFTIDQFVTEFKGTFERNPTVSEKRNFQKALKNVKSGKPVDVSTTSSHSGADVGESQKKPGFSVSSPEEISKFIENIIRTSDENIKLPQFEVAFKKTLKRDPSLIEINYFMEKIGGKSAPPKVINGYTFGEVLGKGSFGEVFKAKKGGVEYAIKEIDETNLSSDLEQNFADSISARLNSKFIVRYFDKFRGPGGELYVVMELCQKGDLRAVIDRLKEMNAVLQTPRVAKILIQLLLALYQLHLNKIIHRDLKPENVFSDNSDNIKVGDFGCSKELDTTSMKANTQIGTPLYESPQVIRGEEYDASADMWALGVLLYELCTLERPFQHTNRFKLQELIFAGKYSPLPAGRYPEEIGDIIHRLLNLNAKERPTACDLLQNPFIQKYAAELGLAAHFPPATAAKPAPANTLQRTSKPSSAAPTAVAKAAAAAAVSDTPSVVPAVPRFVFRVKCKGNRYGYGKKDEDLGRICDCGNGAFVVCSSESESDPSTVSVDRKDIIAVEFGIYSGKAIGHSFLHGCTSLTTPPTIPSSVTSIGDCFLYGCTSLTTPPTIPSSVMGIDDFFLDSCTSLTTPPTIPSSVRSIGDCFLSSCKSLTTPPTIPSSVTSIGDCFLYGCTSLIAPPTIPSSVTRIGNRFLYGCTSLTTPPTIPSSVTSIGACFLSNCTSLTTPPTIPSSVTSIGDSFLNGCTLVKK